jgi:hypothetical protein
MTRFVTVAGCLVICGVVGCSSGESSSTGSASASTQATSASAKPRETVAAPAPTPSAAPTASTAAADVTLAEFIEFSDKSAALFEHEKDCDKLAADVKKFAADNKEFIDRLNAFKKAEPEKKAAMEKALNDPQYKDKVQGWQKAITPAAEKCGKNPDFHDAMGALKGKK